ncbi:MAG: hypothetical protein AB1918_13990, partial [Pseudomonadota bacterium]
AAEAVMAARLSDTGDEVRLSLRDDQGGDIQLTLPVEQMAVLREWIDRVVPASPSPGGRKPAVFAIESWAVRPAEDDETIVVTFRLARAAEFAFALPRMAARRFAHALSVLLGTLPPDAPSQSRH